MGASFASNLFCEWNGTPFLSIAFCRSSTSASNASAVDVLAFVSAFHRAAGILAGAIQQHAELLDKLLLDPPDRCILEIRCRARIGKQVRVQVVGDLYEARLLAERAIE